jgi:molybdopterin converting factor small subunit
MQVKLKLFMKFKDYTPETGTNGKAELEIPEGSTFEDLLTVLNMPVNMDKIIVINGISHKQGSKVNVQQLKDRDVVAIFPPIAGG